MRVISTSWKVWIFLLAATIIIGVATASEHGGVPVTIGGMLTAGNAKSNFDVVQETDKEPSPEPEKINSALAKHIFQLLDGSVHNRHLSNRSINSTSARVDRKGSTPGSGISARKRLRGRETSSRLPPSLNVPLVPKDSVTISQPRSLDEKVPVRTVDDEIRHVAKIMMKLQEKLDYAKATEMRKSQNRPKLPITNIDDGTDLSSERGDTEKLNKTVRKYIEPGGYLSKLQQEAIQFENEKQVKRDGNKSKLANIGGQYKYPNRPISTNIATDGIETEDAVDPTTVVGVRDLPVPISSASKLTPKIINGEDAPLDMYPWYAGLGEGFCGGTLVAPEFILTAAHCLGQFFENVTVGKFCTDRFDNCGQKKDVVNVIDIIPHPKFKFDGEDLSFDIGLVQIERTSIAPTRMDLDGVSSQYADGTQMWVAGFGVDEVPEFVDGTGSSTPNSLQHANVDYIREVACVKSLEGQMVLSNAEQFICATSSPKDSCFGDSGGPLFDNDRNLLLGVVSFGLGCLTGTYPSGYTRVSHFKTWITQNICANHDFPKPTFCDNLDDTPNPTASPTQGPCEDEEITFELDLFTDLFAEETSWQLDDILDGSTVSYGPEQYNTFMPLTEYYSRLCLPCGLYEFTMKDAYGDGLPNGSYTLTINSEIVKANYDTPFSSQITTIDGGSTCGEFTCPDGGMMINLSVVTGASFTTWAFLTDSTPIDPVKIGSTSDGTMEENGNYSFSYCLPCHSYSFVITTNEQEASSYTISVNEGTMTSGTTDTFGGVDIYGEVFYVGSVEIEASDCPTPSPSLSSSPSISSAPTPSPCNEGEVSFILALLTDIFSSETSWDVFDIVVGSEVLSGPDLGSSYLSNSFTYIHECLPCGAYEFTMRDSYGDGLDNGGSFNVTVDGEIALSSINQVFSTETVSFEGGDDCLGNTTGQCQEGQISFELNLLTDLNSNQTFWTIIDYKTQYIAAYGPETSAAYIANTPYTIHECLEYKEYQFTMFDGKGDGLVEGGSFNVLINGDIVHSSVNEIFWSDSFLFGFEFSFSSPPSMKPSQSASPFITGVPSISPSTGSTKNTAKVISIQKEYKDPKLLYISIGGGLAALLLFVAIAILWKRRRRVPAAFEFQDSDEAEISSSAVIEESSTPRVDVTDLSIVGFHNKTTIMMREEGEEDRVIQHSSTPPVGVTDLSIVGYYNEVASEVIEEGGKEGEGDGIDVDDGVSEASSDDDDLSGWIDGGSLMSRSTHA